MSSKLLLTRSLLSPGTEGVLSPGTEGVKTRYTHKERQRPAKARIGAGKDRKTERFMAVWILDAGKLSFSRTPYLLQQQCYEHTQIS